MEGLKVAVVGDGPAGLAAAAIGARLGLDVTLFAPGGPRESRGGVLLHHNGQRVLGALGLTSAVVADGAPVEGLEIELLGGAHLASVRFEELAPGVLHPRVVRRRALLDALMGAARERGAQVRQGSRITGLWLEDGRAHLQTEGGGDEVWDVVLACDGSRSTIREAMAMGGRASPPRDAWIRGCLAPRPGGGPAVVREHWGPNDARFGLVDLPAREAPAGEAVDGAPPALKGFFWCTVPMGEWDAIRAGRMDAWLASWAPFGDPVMDALRRVEDWGAVEYVETAEVDLRRWYEPPVFAVGDAAHAFGPFLGQGLNLALVDACVLTQLLARSRQVRATLDDIGRTWENVRRPVVSRLQATARQLAAVAGVSSTPGRALRDLLLPLASRLDLVGGELLTLSSGHHAIEDDYFVFDPSPLP